MKLEVIVLIWGKRLLRGPFFEDISAAIGEDGRRLLPGKAWGRRRREKKRSQEDFD